MSCQAVAAALALSDLSCGQRLVAFSLASFADRDSRARPGTAAGAARSGLSKSRYLQAREQLVSRGLVVVEDAASGRGRASTLALPFAQAGPWWDGDVNADLFEAVLGYSRTEGPARLLLAVLASNADADGITSDLTTLRVCEAAGLSDRTYRRARKILLASEELVVLSAAGGRGNTNRWRVPDPCQLGAGPPRVVPRRVPVPQGVRPLLAQVIERPPIPPLDAQPAASAKPFVGVPSSPVVGKGGQDRTVLASNRPNVPGFLR